MKNIKTVEMSIDDFINEMQNYNKNWVIENATERDIKGCLKPIYGKDGEIIDVRLDFHSLRSDVVDRLFTCARAAHSFLIKELTPAEYPAPYQQPNWRN